MKRWLEPKRYGAANDCYKNNDKLCSRTTITIKFMKRQPPGIIGPGKAAARRSAGSRQAGRPGEAKPAGQAAAAAAEIYRSFSKSLYLKSRPFDKEATTGSQ